jgi:hypothetical protein
MLFLLSLQVMLRPSEPMPPDMIDAEAMPRSMLISRLVIPTIITPPGIVSLLALSVLSEGNARLLLQVLTLFLVIMLLNLLAMLRARALMGLLTTAGLRVVGYSLCFRPPSELRSSSIPCAGLARCLPDEDPQQGMKTPARRRTMQLSGSMALMQRRYPPMARGLWRHRTPVMFLLLGVALPGCQRESKPGVMPLAVNVTPAVNHRFAESIQTISTLRR